MTTEDYSPGSFGCHEALDRCELLTKLVGDLGEHPAIKLNPAWEEQLVKAASILADLYQEIGRVHLGTNPDDPPDLSTEKQDAVKKARRVPAVSPSTMERDMTPEEIEAEHVRAMASAAFSELTIYRRSENALQQIVSRHWDHPAFPAYARDMGLVEAFAAFKKKARQG